MNITTLFIFIISTILVIDLVIICYIKNYINSIFSKDFQTLYDKYGEPQCSLKGSIVNISFILVKFGGVNINIYSDFIIIKWGEKAAIITDVSTLKLADKTFKSVIFVANSRSFRVAVDDDTYKLLENFREEHNV